MLLCTYIVCLVSNYLAVDEKIFIKFHQLAWVKSVFKMVSHSESRHKETDVIEFLTHDRKLWGIFISN